jgi:DNA polymerase-1
MGLIPLPAGSGSKAFFVLYWIHETLQAPPYLIDAYGLIYRSYFAFLTHPLRNPAGKNVSALFGFARTLVSLLDEGAPAAGTDGKRLPEPQKPLRLAAVFDSRTPTFRHKMYSEYKATRPPEAFRRSRGGV